jgi:glycosyltransferase involved in cell wall biosynthesis
MKIAVDCSWLGPTGIGRVAAEVISRRPNDVELLEVNLGRSCASLFSPVVLGRSISRADADAFWSPGFMPPVSFLKRPMAITIHDLNHLHFYSRWHKAYYDHVIRPLLRGVDLIFTVSDYTRAELLEWSGLSEQKVKRIYNGVSASFVPDGDGAMIGAPYVLYIGNRRGYKNIDRLLRAYAHSWLPGAGIMLALSGARSEQLDRIEVECSISGQVHYFGFIEEDLLPAVYRGAHALIYPSLYEGFGLPVLEAMACGVPVATAMSSSLAEIAGGAAQLFDPCNIGAIADAMNMVCFDDTSRVNLVNAGLQRAKEFSWEASAGQYWATLAELAASRSK